MAPVEWKKIMAVDADGMDEDEADAIFELLAEFDAGGEEDVERLQQLFAVTKTVMSIKAAQFDIATEELEQLGTKAGKTDSEEKRRYEEKISDLENEIKDLKRFGGGDPKNTRFIREEVQDLEKQVEILQEDLKNAERELHDEKQQSERYASRVEELEKELSEVKRENEMQQDEIRDYRQQIDSVRERMQVRRGEDADYKEKIQKKNRELVEALDEIQHLQEVNVEMKKQIDDMAKKMEDSIIQMEKTADEHAKLKAFVQHSDGNIDSVKKENELLKVRIADLQDQLEDKQGGDDDIMRAVNEKVEEWKEILAEKENEVLDYHQQVRMLKEQIAASNIDSERTSIAVLTKAVEERDRQIKAQQDEIMQARSDLESTASIVESLRKDLKKAGKGPADKSILQIKDLNQKLADMRERVTDAEENMKRAEDDASEKDKALNDALERMRQYELGEYGLSEAVDEIKSIRVQVGVRDRQIGELTQHVNRCEMKINDLTDENEQLREKLGIKPEDPVDLATYRLQKNTEKQQDRALNQVLQKEIEVLEEERVELKKEIRRLAQKTGQRAAALGITEEFDLGTSRRGKKSAKVERPKDSDPSAMEEFNSQLQSEIDRNAQLVEKAATENEALKVANEKLVTENKQLQTGLEEVMSQLKEGKLTSGGEIVECPTLEKLVTMLETKRVGGDYDAVVYQKARADNLEGRVDELRKELRESRNEHAMMKLEVSKLESMSNKLQSELAAARDPLLMNRGATAAPLPKTMTATSAEIVASVNECLINVIQDVHLKEQLLKEVTEKLEAYKRKFAVVRHQLGCVYQDYLNEKKTWDGEKQDLEKKIQTLDDEMATKDTRVHEYDRLLDALSRSDSEIKQHLAEEARKITVARVNETTLTRRYNALLDIENAARRENNKLKTEMMEFEITVTERIGYLLRYKDMAAFKIEHLHRELENSVPTTELDALNKKHCELTEKYRDLLEKGNLLVAKKEELRAMEVETDELKRFNEELKKMLEIEKEKCHVLEARFDAEGMGTEGGMTDTQASTISKKLTMLEMKELNERQRAEHAQKMYDQVRNTNRVLEIRNTELESKFAELTDTVLQAQKTEQNLRDQLDGCVTKADAERDRAKLRYMESVEMNLKDEIRKLKQITEVSILQANCLDAQQVSRDKELMSQRQQLIDIQQHSDEKTIIGKLHRQIVRLQVSEGAAVRKYEMAKKRILSLEAHVLRCEEVIDDKEDTFSHKQAEQRSNIRNLKRTIQSLRENFSGAMPLRQVERMNKATADLQNNRAALQSELKKIQDEKLIVQDKLAEMELKHDGLNELVCTFQDGVGAQKVTEWHKKMEELRLVDLKQKRTISKLKQQCKYLEQTIADHEVNITSLEEENVRLTRDFEGRQVLWEERETKLEMKIDQLEKNQAKITSAAASFTAVTDELPDATMPVPEQLDMAVVTIKKNVKTILDVQAENRGYKQKHVELTEKIKRLERDVLTKDRVIAEMRLRMPANADREGIMKMLVDAAATAEEPEDIGANGHALKIAQSTIESLQARIAQKEESIAKYQDLLKQSREDLNIANKRHDEELQLMQEKLRNASDSAFSRFKQISSDIMHQPTSGALSKQQMAKLRELEDVVCQQDNSIAALAEKLKQSRTEAKLWKKKYDDLLIEYENDKTDLVNASNKLETESRDIQAQQENQIHKLTELVSELEKDLQIQKSMSERAPTAQMRKLVDKLKNQLHVKEKQHAALTKALSEVRNDMLQQAEAAVIATNEGTKSEQNVKKLVDKRTAQLSNELKEAKNEVENLNKALTRHQAGEADLRKRVTELQNMIQKREKQMQNVNADKMKLEKDNLELENRLQRLKSSRQKGGVPQTDTNKQEMERLRRTVAQLEGELKRKRDEAEKPYEKQNTAVARWEENKVLQKALNQLKAQVNEGNDEITELKKQLHLTKNALVTANKDKQTLQSRLKAAVKKLDEKSGKMTKDEYENLLQSESFTADRAGATFAAPPTGRDVMSSDTDANTKVRQLSEENMELRFERESMRKDIPRLKNRIQDLHNYIEVLKTENADLKGTSRSLSGTSAGTTSSVRRLGESGKSTRELEKTIMLLKKVIERLQLENERLKKSPGVLRSDDLESVQLENEGLKNQLSELREKFGASLTNRYDSTQKGMAKMRDEYDKIRKDLRKEVEINQKLRIENRHLEIANEQLKNEITVLKSKVEIKEGSQKLNDELWSSNLSQKLAQDKLKSLTDDNEKQAELIHHLKDLLKDSSVREQKSKQEINDLNLRLAGQGIVPRDFTEDHPLTSDQGVDNLLHQVVDLQLENKQLVLERARLQDDNLRLKQERARSAPTEEEFYKLKYEFDEMQLVIADYESKIAQVEQQFGIKV